MNITQLIAALEALRAEHGDLLVVLDRIDRLHVAGGAELAYFGRASEREHYGFYDDRPGPGYEPVLMLTPKRHKEAE